MGAKDSKSALVEYGNYDLKTRLKEAKSTKRLSCTTLQLSTIPKEVRLFVIILHHIHFQSPSICSDVVEALVILFTSHFT
jgi:hypothetical protein